MRKLAILSALLLLLVSACESEPPRPLDEPGQKLWELRGTLLSRNASQNTINVDHETVEGLMTAMTMDFNVRGAKVDQLPPDGTKIVAKLHTTDKSFWVTDVRKAE